MQTGLTVEALVEAEKPGGRETFESLISRWQAVAPERAAAWDASGTDNLDTAGYYGAVFDGRRVVFAPMQHERKMYHGNVLVYDTTRDFRHSSSYRAWDASAATGSDTRGYYGAVFDGRRILFVPRKTEIKRHGRALALEMPDGLPRWQVHTTGSFQCSQGGAFDGRYAYFVPGYGDSDPHSEQILSGLVTRFDTKQELDDPAAWMRFDIATLHAENACFDGACFDGRFVYFAPLAHHRIVRLDTQGDFLDPASWQSYDASAHGIGVCVGAQFDGKWVYFVPYGHGRVVRHRVDGGFLEPSSWETFDIGSHGLTTRVGYDGAFFNGRHVTLIPFVHIFEDGSYELHGNAATYDTLRDFQDPQAWTITGSAQTDGLATVGYNAGAYDGRHFFCAPWREAETQSGRVAHGRILRWDTATPDSAFSLRWSSPGHNGGLCGGVWGPSFVVKTTEGFYGAHSPAPLPAGRHHLAGVYNGKRVSLFVNGRLIRENPASGLVVDSTLPITSGAFHDGGATFHGRILAHHAVERALDPAAFHLLPR